MQRLVSYLRRSLLLLVVQTLAAYGAQQKPNIVLILGDDVGYGDLSCYGGTAPTPNVDKLAKAGLRFTGAYASSATCTPSRYSLLTGEYAFRKTGTGVLPGDAALIIEPGRPTLPSLLKQAGYRTGVVGKWHLGLGQKGQPINWNGEIRPGPLDVGFDYSFIMAATGDRVPCVYMENRKIVNLDPADPIQVNYEKPFSDEPDGVSLRKSLRMDWSHGHNMAVVNGIGRIGYMKGGKSALWKDDDMADTFTRKGVEFIEREKEHPFFLYFCTHDIHVPRVPNARFVGKTTMGPRGDAILEFDYAAGALRDTLERLGLLDNTLIILTSDNGPVLDDGYKDQANEKLGSHKPSGPLRGGKYSMFEGGTRMPMIVAWQGRVKPGLSQALISQVDFPATLASIAGIKKVPASMRDSQDQSAALVGEGPGREDLVEHANRLALRQGKWKYIPPGQTREGLGPWNPVTFAEPGALFDLSADDGEQHNVAAQHPEVVAKLRERLSQLSGGQPSRQKKGKQAAPILE